MNFKEHTKRRAHYSPDENLFSSEAFSVFNVEAPHACLVSNRFLGGGISGVKVGKEILDLLEDKNLNHSHLTNGIDSNFRELQNSLLAKSLKDELASSHTTIDDSSALSSCTM